MNYQHLVKWLAQLCFRLCKKKRVKIELIYRYSHALLIPKKVPAISYNRSTQYFQIQII